MYTNKFRSWLFALFAGFLQRFILSHSYPSVHMANQIMPLTPGKCPEDCHPEYFNIGRDCAASDGRCNCIAHCCLAFDCRDWGNLVQCRRRCDVVPNKFGRNTPQVNDCSKFACDTSFYNPSWDARRATEDQKNCIAHCCYAFDCRLTLGYCRQACGVEEWYRIWAKKPFN